MPFKIKNIKLFPIPKGLKLPLRNIFFLVKSLAHIFINIRFSIKPTLNKPKQMADNIGERIIVKKSCMAFGAFETAKKVSGDKDKIHILVNHLNEELLFSTAYLIAKNFLEEEERARYSEAFAELENPEEITRNKVSGQLHLELTGESILETKKRLRSLKKAKAAQEKEEGKAKKEVPTHNKDGLEYLTLAEFGFKRENFFFVPTPRSFLKVRDQFLNAKLIGFDTEFVGADLSTITLATADLVAVFDMISLKKSKEVKEFLITILKSEDIEIVAHTFRTDAYVLEQSLGIDPYQIQKVLDLTEIVKEAGSDNRLGLQKMVNIYFEKALNQYYKRQDWSARHLEEEMINYAALNGFIVLKIFLMYEEDEENQKKGMKYYDYDPPKGNPIRGRAPAKTQKGARAGKKTTNNNRRNASKNNKGRAKSTRAKGRAKSTRGGRGKGNNNRNDDRRKSRRRNNNKDDGDDRRGNGGRRGNGRRRRGGQRGKGRRGAYRR